MPNSKHQNWWKLEDSRILQLRCSRSCYKNKFYMSSIWIKEMITQCLLSFSSNELYIYINPASALSWWQQPSLDNCETLVIGYDASSNQCSDLTDRKAGNCARIACCLKTRCCFRDMLANLTAACKWTCMQHSGSPAHVLQQQNSAEAGSRHLFVHLGWSESWFTFWRRCNSQRICKMAPLVAVVETAHRQHSQQPWLWIHFCVLNSWFDMFSSQPNQWHSLWTNLSRWQMISGEGAYASIWLLSVLAEVKAHDVKKLDSKNLRSKTWRIPFYLVL